jgi:replicative DNA helicase
VSVTDDVRAPGSAGGGYAPSDRSADSGYDRTPPQDIAAEQCVLGGMLLSKDAIADVVEILRATDFYRPMHAVIFDAVIDMYGRGEPADAITVAAALASSGELSRVGGAGYLHTLISCVPTAANAAYYARIVAERAILRRLVEAGTRIVQMGYGSAAGQGRDVDEVVDIAQQAVYDVTERRVSEDFAVLADMLQPTLDEIEAVGSQGDLMTGVPTGFGDLDRLLNGLHPGQLVVVAGRPGLGKSTAAMDFARTASVKHNLASAIFSLEMSKVEIVTRLLSAESRVPLHVLRSGQLSDDDWTRLARRMGEISEAPLYVDDTPNMTLMEIRAKARRLRQRHDLKLVIVDYLQLMTPPKRVESRQQEVAELSRGLKLLAKEIECPVVAVSQLNRGPEQRTDKRPQLSDLRESGCLIGSTRLVRADTNEEVTLRDLLDEKATDIPVWALDERLKYVPRTMTHAFPSGRRPTLLMRLSSGRQIEATDNHRFLTVDGWTKLARLVPGDRVAVPRHVPPPLRVKAFSDGRVMLMAELIGGDLGPVDPQSGTADGRALPREVFALPKRQIALFLHHLWATGGDVSLDASGVGRIVYHAPSRRLAEGVAMLLMRFGISSGVEESATHRPRHLVDVSGRDDQLRFLRHIGAHGGRASSGAALIALLDRDRAGGVGGIDTVPTEVWSRVRGILTEPAGSDDSLAAAAHTSAGGTVRTRTTRRQRLARIAGVLDTADLDLVATNDIAWDEIVSIEDAGEQDVYDATVLGLHNFIANGIATHNSIEQDADVVILLHRDDYYDKESPRAGEADFIVAKHRNGPTDTVTVAAQLHFSRFVDMAI